MLNPSNVDEIRSRFERYRYVAIESLIEDGLATMLYDHAQRRAAADNLEPAAHPEMKGAMQFGADPLMEHVLRGVHLRIEDLTGLRLYPTYSFLRLYRRGNCLRRHRDRPACEISVSLNLGPPLETPWPLWVQGAKGEASVELAPGDALLYRGVECEHWRERLEAEQMAQVFLHYVDQDGPYREWKFDKRDSLQLGSPAIEDSQP